MFVVFLLNSTAWCDPYGVLIEKLIYFMHIDNCEVELMLNYIQYITNTVHT